VTVAVIKCKNEENLTSHRQTSLMQYSAINSWET